MSDGDRATIPDVSWVSGDVYSKVNLDVAKESVVLAKVDSSVMPTHMLGMIGKFKGAESIYSNRIHEGVPAESSNTTNTEDA